MRFKTILAGVSGGSASNGALELACRFAERFGAHLEAFHARLDPRDLLTYAGDGFGAMSGEFIAASSKTSTQPPRRPRHRSKRPSRAIRFCKASRRPSNRP